ncbi:MAG: plasmid mobilization protein [Candidatus Pararuminococcus gallinarum]
MSTNDEKVCLKVRLTEEEKAKLEHDAALCGLTQSEYLRQICLSKRPQPKQPPEFWKLLDALYEIHDKLERLTAYCPEAAEECSRLEKLVLFLQGVA